MAIRILLEMLRLLAFLKRTDSHASLRAGTGFVKDKFPLSPLVRGFCRIVQSVLRRMQSLSYPFVDYMADVFLYCLWINRCFMKSVHSHCNATGEWTLNDSIA